MLKRDITIVSLYELKVLHELKKDQPRLSLSLRAEITVTIFMRMQAPE